MRFIIPILHHVMRIRIFIPFTALLCFICLFTTSVYGEPFMGPWGGHSSNMTSCKRASSNLNPICSLVKAYRNYISPIDGKTCPMYPSCSKYSLLCFEKHGFFMGWLMTCDRLLHEADEMSKAPVIYVDGAVRFYDPIVNNDFWWHSEG